MAPPVEAAPPLPQPLGDPIHEFIASKLERCEGAIMPAGDMWKLWIEHCAETGEDIGTQKRFTMMLKQRTELQSAALAERQGEIGDRSAVRVCSA